MPGPCRSLWPCPCPYPCARSPRPAQRVRQGRAWQPASTHRRPRGSDRQERATAVAKPKLSQERRKRVEANVLGAVHLRISCEWYINALALGTAVWHSRTSHRRDTQSPIFMAAPAPTRRAPPASPPRPLQTPRPTPTGNSRCAAQQSTVQIVRSKCAVPTLTLERGPQKRPKWPNILKVPPSAVGRVLRLRPGGTSRAPHASAQAYLTPSPRAHAPEPPPTCCQGGRLLRERDGLPTLPADALLRGSAAAAHVVRPAGGCGPRRRLRQLLTSERRLCEGAAASTAKQCCSVRYVCHGHAFVR